MTKKIIISGIQQMGIGVKNADEAFTWYRRNFGMDVPVFKSADVAELMLPYTGGKPQERYAILALNMAGGGGFEIWQYTQRVPQAPASPVALGDYGIFACKIKCNDVPAMYAYCQQAGLNILTACEKNPEGKFHFFVADPYQNVFEMVDAQHWFKSPLKHTGGVAGAVIGVSDMKASMKFYKEVLGYDTVVYTSHGTHTDFKGLLSGDENFDRVLLRHSVERSGGFSPLLGPTEIELVQVKDKVAKKMYEGRYWGDLGFIHLCFDINGMEELEKRCTELGHPFTVNSANSFDMGEAAGHFSYIEDPDGTLIEFVETHKVPIVKKLGFYLNMKKRNPEKSLPRWMLSALGLSRVRD